MNDALCLSIDLGTGGPKIGLVSLDGEVLSYELHSVTTNFASDGTATQDAEQWWSLICETTTRLMALPGVSPDRVKAVAVTGQYASTVPVDANGRPTGPCLTWLDTRGGPFSRRAVGGPVQGYSPLKILKFIRTTGGGPSTSGADPIGQILFLMNTEPDLVARTRWFMEPVDYLTMRFTGVPSATHASRLAMWMTDNRRLNHYDYDRTLLDLVGIDPARLPPLLPFGAVVGTVTPRIAQELGLGTDTVVITGMPDLHSATVGSGGTGLYDAHLALSTTSWISCPVPNKKTDINHSIAAVPGLTNDSYLIINNQETGAKALDWLRNVLAGSGPSMSYGDLTSLAATSPAGANGVSFTPWLAGERSPVDNKRIRAGFNNLSITTTTADLVRAVLEGVAANSAWLLTYVEKFAGRDLSPIRLLGGGAQSTLWCQIYADMLGRPVEQVPGPMVAQLRGAALMASVSLGLNDLAALASTRPPGRSFEPAPDLADLYLTRRRQLPTLYQRDKKWSRVAAPKG